MQIQAQCISGIYIERDGQWNILIKFLNNNNNIISSSLSSSYINHARYSSEAYQLN